MLGPAHSIGVVGVGPGGRWVVIGLVGVLLGCPVESVARRVLVCELLGPLYLFFDALLALFAISMLFHPVVGLVGWSRPGGFRDALLVS